MNRLYHGKKKKKSHTEHLNGPKIYECSQRAVRVPAMSDVGDTALRLRFQSSTWTRGRKPHPNDDKGSTDSLTDETDGN